MPIIGNQPSSNFQSIPVVQRFNGTGSATTFTLLRTVSAVQDILVSVDGVVQDTAAYTIPNGTTLTFSEAPSSGTGNIFVNYLNLVDSSQSVPEVNKGTFKHGGMFRTNAQAISSNVTIEATENASTIGPITVSSGVTLTVNSGGNLAII
tara:strand:- start:2010 stop:2459 length:450 start_codon:yes stop_codon:yes gene_type:complete